MERLAKLSGLSQAQKDHLIHSLWSIIGELRQEVSGLREQAHRLEIEKTSLQAPRGPLRHIHCKLLLAFATFLFTLLACASERGIAELQLDGMPSMDLTTAIKDEINVKNE
jgi:hypothetical protein